MRTAMLQMFENVGAVRRNACNATLLHKHTNEPPKKHMWVCVIITPVTTARPIYMIVAMRERTLPVQVCVFSVCVCVKRCVCCCTPATKIAHHQKLY